MWSVKLAAEDADRWWSVDDVLMMSELGWKVPNKEIYLEILGQRAKNQTRVLEKTQKSSILGSKGQDFFQKKQINRKRPCYGEGPSFVEETK